MREKGSWRQEFVKGVKDSGISFRELGKHLSIAMVMCIVVVGGLTFILAAARFGLWVIGYDL